MNNLFKKVFLYKNNAGYTLIEMVVVVAIFAIMGGIMFNNIPSLAKYTRFQKDALLISDTIRDLQIKGGSVYIKNSNASSDNIKGYGIYLDLSLGNTKSFTIFKDLESGNPDQNGILNSDSLYAKALSISDTSEDITVKSLLNSYISNIYYCGSGVDCNNYSSRVSTTKVSVAFIRPHISPNINYLFIDPFNGNQSWLSADNLFIEIYFPSLTDNDAYKCIGIYKSGQTEIVTKKCK